MTRQEWMDEARKHEEKALELREADDVGSMYEYQCKCAVLARQYADDAQEEISND